MHVLYCTVINDQTHFRTNKKNISLYYIKFLLHNLKSKFIIHFFNPKLF